MCPVCSDGFERRVVRYRTEDGVHRAVAACTRGCTWVTVADEGGFSLHVEKANPHDLDKLWESFTKEKTPVIVPPG